MGDCLIFKQDSFFFIKKIKDLAKKVLTPESKIRLIRLR